QNLDIKTAKKLPVTDADVVLIDLGDPWTIIPQVRKMLKGSGAVFAICPTMNQLEKLTMALIENEFTDIESTEHILRTIDAREGKTRHSFQGIGHTTYLCFARKAFFDRDSKSEKKSSKSKSKTTSNKKAKKASKSK
ncbi:MAG: tRNA methyltransferase, partial [Nitrosopumilaceae archaeon]|nr:tRNA methyltransferase [Nitrosopumilaceae archaeon]